ncbi:hypothetical protein [Pseudomonas canadensis]|uniref:hypothetical protein n=1 Tax=Pseudomonas canadensis TaxID=915099 RepID=UPI002732E478|nr:hypothetical protein [Pseudomonas canadensis]WLH29939.1 hypothetical protein PSH56_28585 [Pseudomonas canadensis]
MDTTLRAAMLVEEGKRRIISSGDWVTPAELVELTAQTVDELTPDVYSLLREGRIFAIGYGGVDYFPTFAFDAYGSYQPVPGLKAVIEVLATRKDAWGMAFWFGSSNSYLGGRQPKEVLRTDLGIVLDAARDEVCGILHG